MKPKQILFSVTLAFASFLVNAQDKYEFMIIVYQAHQYTLFVSVDNKELIREEVKLEKEEKTYCNAKPLLKKVNEYQEQNWELMSFTTIGGGPDGQRAQKEFVAYLKKKKGDKK